MKVPSKSQKLKMGDDAKIVQGVTCPIARWIHRGICMLTSVSWLIMLALDLFWPEFSWSSSPPPKQKDGLGKSVVCSVPPLVYAVVVVRSFYLPVPTASDLQGGGRLLLSWFLAVMTISMCGVTNRPNVEMSSYMFLFISGFFSAFLLELPAKGVCVQHVVYTYFVLALTGYLGFQRPVWPAYLFVVALVIVNAFLFYGVLRLDPPEPPEEEEEEEEDYKDSPV